MVSAAARASLAALASRSVSVIRENQASSGAYLAAPDFSVYRYCWFRDGAFIADAMSRAGQVESAEAFFGWCTRILIDRKAQVEDLVARRERGETIPAGDFLHTRYTVDGRESDLPWENFQLDGYGTWLWALDAHVRRYRRPADPFLEAAGVSALYIATFHDYPSYDWWEEHAAHRHTSTLAAVAAGLRAYSGWPSVTGEPRTLAMSAAADIVSAIRTDAAGRGHLGKWLGGDAVDGSLIAVATPFGVIPAGDPLMTATVARIGADLVHRGGVHRYLGDTYYGGGEWLLLAAFLGSYRLEVGDRAGAIQQLEWIAAHATAEGDLPEQVDDHLLAPDSRQAWLDRWGPVATPLVWSHAMYLGLAIDAGIVAAPVAPG